MVSLKRKILLTLLLTFFNTVLYGQTNAVEQVSSGNLPDDIHLETVEGEIINLNTISATTIVLYLLPKPQSMAEGKETIEDVRSWMKWINKRSIEEVYALLVVVPYKTSFPFYNIQKGRLKDEPFPVVIDKNGETLKRMGVRDHNLRMLTVDNSLQILENQPGSYSEQKVRDFMDQLKGRQ